MDPLILRSTFQKLKIFVVRFFGGDFTGVDSK